jgi:hypothetical protein
MAEQDAAARCTHVLRHRLGDRRVVHDGGAGRMHGCGAACVRFEFGDAGGVVDAFQIGYAIRARAPFDLIQGGELRRIDGDHELADLAVRQALLLAELAQLLAPRRAEGRFQ